MRKSAPCAEWVRIVQASTIPFERLAMTAKKLSALVAAAIVSVIPWAAYAQEMGPQPMDLHHWFEHERAKIEGGDILLQTERFPHTVAAHRSPATATSKHEHTRGVAETNWARPDCLLEELKRAEGYVPPPPCGSGPRWTDHGWR